MAPFKLKAEATQGIATLEVDGKPRRIRRPLQHTAGIYEKSSFFVSWTAAFSENADQLDVTHVTAPKKWQRKCRTTALQLANKQWE